MQKKEEEDSNKVYKTEQQQELKGAIIECLNRK